MTKQADYCTLASDSGTVKLSRWTAVHWLETVAQLNQVICAEFTWFERL